LKIETGSAVFQVLVQPTEEEIRATFPHHNAEKILRHLDPSTGEVGRGEVACVEVDTIVFSNFMLEVGYKTIRPDGKQGTQFMGFWTNQSTMRCLAVTKAAGDFGPRVVMVQEYRRQRGAWTQMLVAGGEKKGRVIDTLLSELMDEAGCASSMDSHVLRIGREYMDDGLHAEPLDLLTIDGLEAPESHVYAQECIRGITLVPWHEWRSKALRGEYDDIYCTIFAARCDIDKQGRIVVRGKQEVLR
jgi:hypothetical protein